MLFPEDLSHTEQRVMRAMAAGVALVARGAHWRLRGEAGPIQAKTVASLIGKGLAQVGAEATVHPSPAGIDMARRLNRRIRHGFA